MVESRFTALSSAMPAGAGDEGEAVARIRPSRRRRSRSEHRPPQPPEPRLEALPEASLPDALPVDSTRAAHVGLEILPDLIGGVLAEDDRIDLIVEQHTALVEVRGADERPHIIDDHALRMHDAVAALVHLDAGSQQL